MTDPLLDIDILGGLIIVMVIWVAVGVYVS